MAEDNKALFHWPSTWKWHHKNNNDHGHGGSYLQNQNSYITGDNNTNSNINSKTNQNGNATGLRGLRIKIIGPSPPNNNSNNVQCHVCNQGFTSAKSLAGHMRIHNVRKRKVSSCVEKPSCYICGKTFSSDKSLFGHMRVHPQTPTSSFDSSESPWGRSPTGKRSRRRDKGLEQGFEVDSLMQEAAYTLMLLSKGKNRGDEVKKLAGDHVDLVPPSTKKPRIQEKSLAMVVGNEKGSFQTNFGDSDGRSNQIVDQFGSYLSTPDHMQHYANNTTMQVGGIKASADEDNDIIRHDQGKICNKTSSTGQANMAETQSAKAMEKGQNRFQIFIGHYQPPTMDKGKGIQPELPICSTICSTVDGTGEDSGQLIGQAKKFSHVRWTHGVMVMELHPYTSHILTSMDLSKYTDDLGLREAFSEYGAVIEASRIWGRGFGFVTFWSLDDTMRAVQGMDGQVLNGSQIRVDYADDRSRAGYGFDYLYCVSGYGGHYRSAPSGGAASGCGNYGRGGYGTGGNYGGSAGAGKDGFGTSTVGGSFSGSGMNYLYDGNFTSGGGNFGGAGGVGSNESSAGFPGRDNYVTGGFGGSYGGGGYGGGAGHGGDYGSSPYGGAPRT